MAYTILVPVHSLDEHISELVNITDNLCKHEDSKLILLHVLPDLEGINQAETSALLEQANNLLGDFADKLCCDVDDIEMRMQMGSPEQEILKCIIIEQIDIVAMPTNGHTGINRLLLGSVAEHVIRHAQCPVVTTRKCDKPGDATSRDFKRILLPLDGTDESMKVIPMVVHLAVLHDADVILFYDESGINEDQFQDTLEEQARTRLEAVQAALIDADIKVKLQMTQFKNPAEEITRMVDELDIDLVAMTTHGRTGLSRLVFGSVAEQFLQNSKCPLLTLSIAPTGTYDYKEQHLG